MLTELHIKNFTLIHELYLEFKNGLTVLTGETGAGKSIMIDALGLALGNRTGGEVVRQGQEQSDICARFSLTDDEVKNMQNKLEAQGVLIEDNELILRRTVHHQGRSKCYINGSPATVSQLREIGIELVDIHGQHEHHSLLRPVTQQQLLDEFAQNLPLLTELQNAYRHHRELCQQRDQLKESQNARLERLSLLQYQLEELEALAPEEDELNQLEKEQSRLAHAERIASTLNQAVSLLSENDVSIVSQLSRVQQDLSELQQFDTQLAPIATQLEQALILLQETSSDTRHYAQDLEIDPARLTWVEGRLSTFYTLARKHHIEAHQLPEKVAEIHNELQELNQESADLQDMEANIAEALAKYRKKADKLSERRRKAGKRLEKTINTTLPQLGLEHARIEIALEALDESALSETGVERILFLIATAPGQAAKPLAKVASGGELSRISLAIQMATSAQLKQATLIFDEVDVGIGGRVAEIVGRLLRQLGQQRQVLCVTHLPQVAAQGHHHIQVEKQIARKKAQTAVRMLDSTGKRDEIARMLGGVELTEQTLAHAQEMIQKAQQRDELN